MVAELTTKMQQTEVGEIPEDWEVVELGEVCDFQGGAQPYLIHFSKTEKPGHIRLIQIRDYKTDAYAVYIPKELARKCCTANDIMIGRYGPPIFQILRGLEGGYNVALIKAVPKGGLPSEYLYQFLRQERLHQFVEKLSQRSGGQTGIDLEEVRKYPFPLPPTPGEQQAIATALNDCDRLINALEALIAKKEGIRQGAMQELLRPKEEWKSIRIGDAFTFLRTANNSRADLSDNGDVGYIHYGDIHTKWSKFLDCRIHAIPSISADKVASAPNIEDGDLVMADASEDYAGLCDCVEVQNVGSKRIVAGLHTFLLRADKSVLIDGFKGYFKHYWGVREALHAAATGVSVYSISKSNLAEVTFQIPPVDEQICIAKVLSDMDAEIATLNNRLAKTRLIKAGMMQQLLSGKKRLV